MKKIFFLITALFPVIAFAQSATETFIINGKMGNVSAPAKIYLSYQLGANSIIDSADIVNGVFSFRGSMLNPVNATLVVDYKGLGIEKFTQQYSDGRALSKNADNLNFFIDKGPLTITSKDSISKAQITGSQLNLDNVKLQDQLRSINLRAERLMAEVKAATPEQQKSPTFQSSVQSKYKALQTLQSYTLKSFIGDNPNSYLSLLALSSVGGPSPDPGEIEPMYNSLSESVRNTEAGKVLKAQLDALKFTAIGSMAPDFTQDDVNGTPVKLSSFRGKYVLLDFWASWCGPCRQENPNVVRNYNKYKAKNFTVLGVSLDKPDSRSAWLDAIKNDGLEWTQVSDLKFWNNAAAALYSITSIPQNYLIGPDGKIIAKNLRGADLDAKLQELFGKI
ncbi:TlpA disulfide reductase family protein [Mucilaginibacter sp. FT3.2]|uniref:TlpA disulfide reductase family protein n=1 Tax=Mucilaginibacter sp. FT3.2 TaxID=2723090 RepID=UPI0016153615|nr:TlpA disulfide reductase family protein [Mucilaginibacter sp. FT3.2]MBB6232276.1 peroxiredoxin [Mucilaginibacter sp. FT3.2]